MIIVIGDDSNMNKNAIICDNNMNKNAIIYNYD